MTPVLDSDYMTKDEIAWSFLPNEPEVRQYQVAHAGPNLKGRLQKRHVHLVHQGVSQDGLGRHQAEDQPL